jgi:hypothetical protein
MGTAQSISEVVARGSASLRLKRVNHQLLPHLSLLRIPRCNPIGCDGPLLHLELMGVRELGLYLICHPLMLTPDAI